MRNVIVALLLAAPAFAASSSMQPTAQTVAQLSFRFQELQSQGFAGVQWHDMRPMGANYVEVALVRRPCCDQYEFTALVPVGVVAPGAKATDPNDAYDFFIERSGGKTGKSSYAGPFSVWSKAALADFAAQHEADIKTIPGVASVRGTCVLNMNRCTEVLWVMPDDTVKTFQQMDAIRQAVISKYPELRNARVVVTAALPA